MGVLDSEGSPLVLQVGQLALGRHGAGHGGLHVGALVHQLELQVGGAADDVDGPLGIVEARKLDDDAVAHLLADVGFGHAELVDAVADGLEGLIHGQILEIFDIGVRSGQHVPHLAVAGVFGGRDLEAPEPALEQAFQLLALLGLEQGEFNLPRPQKPRPQDHDLLLTRFKPQVLSGAADGIGQGGVEVHPRVRWMPPLRSRPRLISSDGQHAPQGGIADRRNRRQHIQQGQHNHERGKQSSPTQTTHERLPYPNRTG
jgi:hypothetical protein